MEERIATAEWADPALVEKKYLYRDGEVWLGRSASDHMVPLGFCDDRHVTLVSGSRGGKGTSSIINNLIVGPGSICCVDCKGENATITASRRGKGSQYCTGLGQAVQVLDPFKTAHVDDSLRGRFNPLDALAADKEETIDEASRIADALVVVHQSNDPFWDESARSMVKGLLLHVLTAPEYEGRRNLITVRNLILRGDWEAVDALKAAGETGIPPAHGLLWTGLVNNPAFGGLVAGIGDSFTNMLLNSPKQYESVLQVANRNTEFIDSPGMQRCLEASDFQLSDLKTRPGGLSVYLCLPQMYMSTHYRWLRMMIGLIVTEMEKVGGRPATGHPVLMILDEFAGMQRMEIIENAVAQIAGYGVKLFFVLQSLEQLKAVYKDNWETFLANSGLKVFFNLEDNFSRDYVSKLIGETEVMREVASESETKGESESTSHSTTRSQSETHGTSSSTGTSESDGTNSSASTGKSWGINSALSISKNLSYVQGMLFKNYDKRTGVGSSQSQGKSEGWTEGLSKGLSHSISSSRTAGTSESVTTGTSETEGTTHGTSQSSTSGTSETIQKRALITSDEIGQVFARIDDKTQLGYPGLALVIISGARPLALIRVNYYEDYQFMGLFDPAPDFPFNAPKDLCVDGGQMGLSLPEFGLKVGAWTVTAGNIAASNDGAASIVTGEGKSAACIRVPRNGLVTTVQAGGADVPAGPLFSLRYYEDGAALIDPFAELRALCAAIAKQREDEKRKAAERKHRRKLVLVAAVACLGLLVVIVGVAHLTGGSASTPEIEPAPLAVSRSASVANVPLNQPGPTAPARSNSSISESAIMIGSVDVSHLLGIKAGDTIEQVDALYEPSVPEQDDRNRPRTYAGTALLVRFSSGRATGMTLNKTIPGPWKLPQSDMDNDPVFALYERSEADVIAVLGPPSSREAKSYADVLYWAFPNSDVKLDANGLPIQKVIIAEFATLAGSNKPARVVRLTINW